MLKYWKKLFCVLFVLWISMNLIGCAQTNGIANSAEEEKVKSSEIVLIEEENDTEKEEENQDGLKLDEMVALTDELKKAAYIKALERIAYEHVSPDNEQWSETGITKYAIYDIDRDEREELVILQDDGTMAGMGFYIYDYNEKENLLYQELIEFPALKFYENGMIEALASHNHGMAPGCVLEDFWPYSLYQYNEENDTYEYLLNVDAWEKEYNEKAWTGEEFQDKADIDGDGVLYYIMTDGKYNYDEPIDGEEYYKWRTSILGDELEMNIPFIELPYILPEAEG